MADAGRPTIYSEDILDKAREYLTDLPKDEVVHSIEGLADYIQVSRSNIYLWASQEDKEIFSDIVEQVREKQSKTLVNKGLNGDFNAPITKLMLTKHGYVDKQETDVTTGGDKITANNPEALAAAATAYAATLKEQKT